MLGPVVRTTPGMFTGALLVAFGARSRLDPLPQAHVKGRDATVHSYRVV